MHNTMCSCVCFTIEMAEKLQCLEHDQFQKSQQQGSSVICDFMEPGRAPVAQLEQMHPNCIESCFLPLQQKGILRLKNMNVRTL